MPDNEPQNADAGEDPRGQVPVDDSPEDGPLTVGRPIDRSIGPDRMPRRPGVSLIDAGFGAHALASRVAKPPLGAFIGTGRRLGPLARRALAAASPRGLTDLACWTLRTLAQVGAPQRAHAERRARVLARGATRAVAENRYVTRLVRDLTSGQLEPLIDEALPIVLARLAEQPEELRRTVESRTPIGRA